MTVLLAHGRALLLHETLFAPPTYSHIWPMKHDDISRPVVRLIAFVIVAAIGTIGLAAALFGDTGSGATSLGVGVSVALLLAALGLGWWAKR